MKKTPILVAAAIIAASFCDIVQAQTLEIQLNSRTYTNGYEVSCHGAQNGSIEAICINGNEPFAYQWSNGASTQSIDNLAAGTYTVTVYDWNNNSGQKEITLREPDVLEAFLTADVCAGGTNICQQGESTGHIYSEIRGGSPPYTYLWNTGSVSQTIDGVPAGTYTLTVTDINGCTSTQNITLTEPSALHIVSITSPQHHGFNISCHGQNDGAITLSVAGGVPPYSFQWNNGSMDQNPQALEARVYMVKVYDQNGAMATGQITLTQPAAINVVITPYVYSNGFNLSTFNSLDGSITTNITGGAAPYTYTWQTIPQKTTANIANLPAGGYELMLYDANSCYSYAYTELKQPERDDWTMTGNAGSNPVNQFIGTTDNTDLVFKTNNAERLKLNGNGDVKVNSLKSDSTTNKYRYVYVDDNGIIKSKYIPYCSTTMPDPWLLGGNTINVSNPQSQYFGSCNWADVVFGTSATERMRLSAIGWLGVGIANPVHIIDVQGTGRFRNYSSDPNTIAGTVDIGYSYNKGFVDASASLRLNYYSNHDVEIGQNSNSNLITNSKMKIYGPIQINNGLSAGLLQIDASGNVTSTTSLLGLGLWSITPLNTNNVYNTNSGNVGIGTNDPIDKFQVDNGASKLVIGSAASADLNYGNAYIGFNAARKSPNQWLFNSDYEHNGGSTIWSDMDGNLYFSVIKSNQSPDTWTNQTLTDFDIGTSKMSVKMCSNGIVGIGTSSSISFDTNLPYKLYVKGGIRTEKLKIDIANTTGWGDLVFKEGYDLKDLDQLNNYLQNYHHLPNIPSAEEIAKEGIDVQEMLKSQMIKIEELTLYVINLNKEIKEFKKR